jgi:chorismate mutase
LEILRRIVEAEEQHLSPDAAKSILKLQFSRSDRRCMNRLAANNRKGELTPAEEEELWNYIRVGQTLGILQSKARRSLKRLPQDEGRKNRKP